MKNKILKFLPLSVIISSLYTNVSAMESIEDMEDFFKEIIQEDMSNFDLIEENGEAVMSSEEINKEAEEAGDTVSNDDFNLEEYNPEDDIENTEISLEDFVIDQKEDKKENEFQKLDVVFLRNVPEGTRFTVNKDFVILPLHRYVIFHEGDVVVKSPQHENALTTFCYFELEPSGKARILKEGRKLTVVKNTTTSKTYRNKNETWRGDIKVFESKLHIDNPHLKTVSCYSASTSDLNKTPLRIKDLREQTGNALSVEFPAYEEI